MLYLTDSSPSALGRLALRSSAALLAGILLAIGGAGVVVTFAPSSANAQGIDPSDVWFRAYLLLKEGEQMEEQGELLSAYNKYVESKQLLDAIGREHPEFHPGIVRYRRKFLADKTTELRTLMKQQNSGAGAGAGTSAPGSIGAVQPQVTPGGVQLPGRAPEQPPVGSSPEFPAPLQPVGDPSIVSPPQPIVGPGIGHGVGGGILDTVPADPSNPFSALQQQYDQMKAEVERLNAFNASLQKQLNERQRQVEAFQTELAKAREREKALQEQVAKNAGASPETVNELKRQLGDAMQLAKEANQRSDSLLAEFEASRAEFAVLQTERDRILRERDQLAAVIDHDAGKKQITTLMEENERLRTELDDTRKLAEALREESSDKDTQLIALKEQLAGIEKQRVQLLEDNARHQGHIAELQQHLKELGKDDLIGPSIEIASLDTGTAKTLQENGLLRDIVLRQLSRQNQLKQAKEALIEQLQDLGVESASLLATIDDIVDGASLTEQEKEMIRQPEPDESTGPMEATIIVQGKEADGSGEGIVSVQSLEEELQQIQKAARLDYREGRFDEAQAGYEEYLRHQPESVEGTCNLALVHLSMKSYDQAKLLLETAIAYDNEAGRPHYLLGVLFFRQGELDEALGELELGIDRDPKNARAHNYVGVICSQKGLENRAEDAFTEAATLDPEFPDPHFNLAVLYTTGESPDAEKARKHYGRALDLGAERDAGIERFLDSSAAAGTTTTASTF